MPVGTPRHNEVIYRRRRIAALVILLVVIALAIWGLTSLGGESPEETDTDTAAATTTLDNSVDIAPETTTETTGTAASSSPEDAAGSSVSAAEGTTEESPEPTGAPKESCELSDLIITAGSNKPNFAPGEEPQLYMTVENPTAADCEVDLDDEVLRFEVYNLATNARVWADVDCNPAVETGTRVFPAGEERYFQTIWSRTTSAPERYSNRQPVPAGAYFLHTVIGDNPSQALTFNLG